MFNTPEKKQHENRSSDTLASTWSKLNQVSNILVILSVCLNFNIYITYGKHLLIFLTNSKLTT